MVTFRITSCVLGLFLVAAGTGESRIPPHGPRDCGDVFRAGAQFEGYFAAYPYENKPYEAALIHCSINDGMIPRNTSDPRTNPKNCKDLKDGGMTDSGINIIYPYADHPETPVIVYCDQHTSGGGWTVFQRRDDYGTQQDFYNSYDEYALGFGNAGSELWLGNEILHQLTSQSVNELYIDLTSFSDENKFARYSMFDVGPRDADHVYGSSGFQLTISHYVSSSTAGDSFSYHNGMKFSTYDHDADNRDDNNYCTNSYKGGWWYGNCAYANLNGVYYDNSHVSNDAAWWYTFNDPHNEESLKKIVMMCRPLQQQ